MSHQPAILVAEDSEDDVYFIQRAIKQAALNCRVSFARDGIQATDVLEGLAAKAEEKLPDLVVVDLKMPGRNGIDVLRWMRSQPATRCIPALVFSSSSHTEDIEQAYQAGANGFIVKPTSTGDYLRVANFIKQWLEFIQAPLGATRGVAAAEQAFRARPEEN